MCEIWGEGAKYIETESSNSGHLGQGGRGSGGCNSVGAHLQLCSIRKSAVLI